MNFEPFALVEWQSRYEPTVDYSLADSSCRPVALREFVDDAAADRLFKLHQHYPSVAGTTALRGLVADWLGAEPGDVLVTVGAAEANTLAIEALVRPGDHVVVMEPGYRQIWGSARNAGAKVDAFPLDPTRGWHPDLAALEQLVRSDTKLITIINPNNPAGSVLTEPEMAAIVAIAERSGAWLLVDEVHRGTELDSDALTPTFWGRYDRVVCVGSLSKAFGLPGLRVGWLAAPPQLLQQAWRRHEYTTVATGMLSMRLAEIALAPPHRDRLLARNRRLMRDGRDLLHDWVRAHSDLVSIVPSQATALGFIRYRFDMTSLAVADALRVHGGVLVAAGAHFGAEGHFRITHALDADYTTAALARIADTLAVCAENPGGLRAAP